MKKIFTFIAALTLSVGLFAEDATSILQKHSLWQGTLPISWSSDGQIDIADSGFEEVPAGAELVLCYTQVDQTWGQARICFGDWSSFKNLTNPDGTIITNNDGSLVPIDIYGWFEDGTLYRETPIVLSEHVLAEMRARVDDEGNILHIQGHDLIFNEIYVHWTNLSEVDMKPLITYEQPDPIFDYPYYPSWDDNTGKLRIRRDNGLQDLNLEAGVSKIVFYKTASSTGQIQINDPNWSQLATVADWDGGLTTLEYVLDEYAIECINGDIVDGWGETAFVLQGDGLEVTKITIVTETSPLPFDPQFVDVQSGLTFRVTDFGDVNNVKVVSNNRDFSTYSGDIVIPSTVNYQDVTFTVTRIGSGAFYGCSGLTSVTIPSSVTTIGDDAFYLVNNIVYNGTATGSPWGAKCVNGYVDGYLVYSDASKTTLCGCYSAATGEIIIPNSVKTIGDYSFKGCSGLTSITIPNSVTTIGSSAFFNCTSLTSVTIGNFVTTIGEQAFWNCYSLTSVNIPNSVTTIGNYAFSSCTGLTSITIPSSVTTIGDHAFYLVNNIVYNGTATGSPWGAKCVNGYVDGYLVYSDASKTTLCGCYSAATGEIIIPNSVTTIGERAFSGCSGLTSITIPNSVKTIGDYAFSSCTGLTSITIPNSVTTIGNYAFSSCTGLTSVTVQWTNVNELPTMGDGVFSGIADWTGPSAATLHVLPGTKSIYETADQWKDFGTIIEPQVGDVFEVNGLWYQILTIGEPNMVKVVNHPDYANLQTISIPNYITYGGMKFDVVEIGHNAFYGCSNLTKVEINSDTYLSQDFDSNYEQRPSNVFGSQVTEYVIGNSVTAIGDEAFYYCSDLTSVTIGNSVTTIGEEAFEGCSGLTSVTIGNSVTTIGEEAFEYCSSLTKVEINSDTYLSQDFSTNYRQCPSRVFGSQVTEYVIGNSVTAIGTSAFQGCSGLTLVSIPNSVTTIGESAFQWCSGLTSVTIPNSVTTIGEMAFVDVNNIAYNGTATGSPWGAKCVNGYVDGYLVYSDASKTTLCGCSTVAKGEIIIPSSVTAIREMAFDGCWKLTSIIIPNSVTTIGESAFYNCSSLTTVTIPNSVKTIGGWAFSGCSSLPVIDNIRYADTYLIEAVDKTLSTYTIKEETKWIGDWAFSDCSRLTSISIPNSVTTIGEYAFAYCYGLTSVTIPNSVTAIGDMAFRFVNNIVYSGTATGSPWGAKCVNGYVDGYLVYSDASKTTLCGCSTAATGEVIIPNSVTTIEAGVFSNCSGLTSFNVDVANTHYCSVDGVLFDYAKDTLIQYPASNTRTEYTIPNSVTTIGDYAFYQCSSLASVAIPNSVTTIGVWAFSGCSGLTSVNIPNSVTTIKSGTFQECSSLISITIPNSVTEIEGWGAFSECTSLESVTIGNSVKTIGEGTFCNCYSLTSVNIPNSVTTIGRMAFASCTTLVSIEIPASVTTIDQNAFAWNYALTSITIPKSVKTIGEGAFCGWAGLSSVTVQWTDVNELPTMGNDVFASIADGVGPSAATLHVLPGTKSIYETADQWKDFGQITEPHVGEKFGADGLWYQILTLGETNTVKVVNNSHYANLQTVKFPSSVLHHETMFDLSEIGDSAFFDCYNMTSIEIPNFITTIGENAFYNVNNIVYNGIATGSPWGAKCVNGYVDGNLVYSDASKTTLCGCFTTVTGEIIIPNSVTTIGGDAFEGCSGLTSITIPNSVTTIGESAFEGCTRITSVTWNAKNCNSWNFGSQVETFVFGNEVEIIPNSLCSRMSKLTTITIPNSVTTIGDDAFYGCNNLKTVYNNSDLSIRAGATSHGYVAYYADKVYDGIPVGDFIIKQDTIITAYIGKETKITIPDFITTIKESAFAGCKDLTSITIPNSVTSIGNGAFEGCTKITSVTWNAKNCNSWNFGSQVESFTFGNEVETIPNELCKGMSKLTSVIIPNSVISIGESAFEDCTHLANVTLGSNLSEIGCNAFKGDFRLEEITIFAEYTPDVCSTTFDGVSKQYVYLYVPENSIRKYQVDPNWNGFDIRTKAAEKKPMDDENPIVTPSDQDVTITWPITDGTDTYTLTITKNGEIVCVLTFNANGQLTNIAFAAPGHNGARQAPAATLTAQGYQFTVTGLNPGTAYEYSVTATDAGGQTLAEHKGNFSTTGGGTPTSVDEVHGSQCTMHKVLRNGQILLERNNATYTLMGQKVR